ncbi:hypothetical protein JIG36_08900 [Actinoplanes sp. LDG1-06]|uniref:Uncharacterized protein n=1 Tax=Paractinoplanes ovalisporus TaxID=2810368 RepID=A0ABS2A751_9ACTN|nr:hypothetical protein [Actinoplanes ovalisporus]MBM2615669.1 hypothetical protein [Actinoplanes ovalisporus]
MRAKWWGATTLSVVALAWGGAGYLITKPVDFHDYRVAAVSSAETAHDALTTAGLVAEAELKGQVMGPYAESSFDDARKALAGGAKKFTGVEPPDERCERMHDELAPLLQQADAVLARIPDEPHAGDDVSDALERFVEQHT